jgi:hypothetical protein
MHVISDALEAIEKNAFLVSVGVRRCPSVPVGARPAPRRFLFAKRPHPTLLEEQWLKLKAELVSLIPPNACRDGEDRSRTNTPGDPLVGTRGDFNHPHEYDFPLSRCLPSNI